ncbi:hypothetical protein MKK69_17010 [Methylobacterium sp. J-026]|uniref:hypothetical protein n=1 Tax=Methylobacterium sp. J-026 TaxID=2836624 RepID=UPI001FB9A08B|nr:hypothetical protein [Methylobacterium sp. J-026]MCJ2135733.1 hypothetical protein [Methylobacterium sp. J-026]
MTDQQISEIVHDVLRNRVPAAQFLGADVWSDTDFDGDPIIRVTARYGHRPTAKPDPLIAAVHDLRSALLARGEDRFVFLSNDVADEQRVEEDVD